MEESNSHPDGIPEEGTYLTQSIITSYKLKFKAIFERPTTTGSIGIFTYTEFRDARLDLSVYAIYYGCKCGGFRHSFVCPLKVSENMPLLLKRLISFYSQ